MREIDGDDTVAKIVPAGIQDDWADGDLAELVGRLAQDWAAGIDLRLILVGSGILMIAGDIALRRSRTEASPAPSTNEHHTLPLPDRPSLPCCPFANLSGDPEQEYFSDGVADDIITALSHDRALFVIARTSSFTYRGRSADIRKVAQEIGVRYILQGSVRRDRDRVRVTAQLIDAVRAITSGQTAMTAASRISSRCKMKSPPR